MKNKYSKKQKKASRNRQLDKKANCLQYAKTQVAYKHIDFRNWLFGIS